MLLRPRDDPLFHENIGISNGFYSKSLVFEAFQEHVRWDVTSPQSAILTPERRHSICGSTSILSMDLSKRKSKFRFFRLSHVKFMKNDGILLLVILNKCLKTRIL